MAGCFGRLPGARRLGQFRSTSKPTRPASGATAPKSDLRILVNADLPHRDAANLRTSYCVADAIALWSRRTPGPMVDLMETRLMYVPFAPLGFARLTASTNA